MGKCNLSGGGVRANLRAAVDIPADRLWKYDITENLVTLCGAGEMADGIALTAVKANEILNRNGGQCHSRKDTGIYEDLTYAADTELYVGEEWMCGASGVITAYVAAGNNRPMGKVLAGSLTDDTVKISFYGQ